MPDLSFLNAPCISPKLFSSSIFLSNLFLIIAVGYTGSIFHTHLGTWFLYALYCIFPGNHNKNNFGPKTKMCRPNNQDGVRKSFENQILSFWLKTINFRKKCPLTFVKSIKNATIQKKNQVCSSIGSGDMAQNVFRTCRKNPSATHIINF